MKIETVIDESGHITSIERKVSLRRVSKVSRDVLRMMRKGEINAYFADEQDRATRSILHEIRAFLEEHGYTVIRGTGDQIARHIQERAFHSSGCVYAHLRGVKDALNEMKGW